MALTWANETRKLSELIPWEQNARQIREQDAERLVESLEEFGQVETLAIEPDGGLIDGHQRRYCWSAAAQFGPDYEVDVRVASRELTDREKQKLSVLLHKGAHGEWDFEELANWGLEAELLDWGFEEEELQFFDDGGIDDNYSRKIESPVYEPRGRKPKVTDLYDDSRTQRLIEDIDSIEGIGEEEREFLRIAAQRHTVLNFERIADYYAHSEEQVQALMEDSALVIIDFDKAIELGFVKLTKNIAQMVNGDYGAS